MNDVIGGGETPQQNEAIKHSFKNLKTQAKTLIGRDIGGRFQLCLLHRKELKDNGTQVTQVKESLFWGQKPPIEKTLKSDGLVVRLRNKKNKTSDTFFLFEPADLGKGKNDMDLKSIIIDNPAGKKESYRIDFNEDGSLKITQTNEKGIESEISADQFPHLKEIDSIKNILSIAHDNVEKRVKENSLLAGTVVAGIAAGAGVYTTVEYFTKLEIPTEAKATPVPAAQIEVIKTQPEYKFDPSLVEKLGQTDVAIEKIKKTYGIDFDIVTMSYHFLNLAVHSKLDPYLTSKPLLDKQDVVDFFTNKRSMNTKKRISEETKFIADPENKASTIVGDNSKKNSEIFLKRLFESFMKKDTGRISKIFFASDSNGNSDGKGGILGFNSLKTTLGQYGSNFLWDEIKNFFHESTHLTTGLFGSLFESDDNSNFIHINGYSADHIADQLVEWTNIFANNPEFFKKYFFNIQGDGTFNLFKETNSLQRSLDEIMTISCANYFFNERANWMGDGIKKYSDIERAIRRQLAVTFYGGEALIDSPDGVSDDQLASIRHDFGRNYILGLAGMMSGADDLGEVTLKALSGDLNKYYTENTAGYLVADGEPAKEINRRFIEENNLEAHISSRPINNQGSQKLQQINEFIVRYGRTFFPDGKI